MSQEEKEIIILCQKGQLDNFVVLYEKYFKKIYAYVFFKVGQQSITEDIVSETFLQALKSIKGFDIKKAYFSAWLYKISQNKVNDYYRKRKINYSLDEIWELRADNNLLEEVQDKEEKDLLYKMIKDLKKSQQEIIILRVLQNLSYKEISAVIHKSEGACKMIFKRAIKKLKKQID